MPYITWEDKAVFYREEGEGELLFILPGNTASSICHLNDLSHFSKDYHVVSIDFLGTGLSDRVEVWDENWWYQSAKQVHALMKHLGYKRCLLMGTSGGSAVALNFAITYPEAAIAVIADSCGMEFSQTFVDEHIVADRKQRTPAQIQFWEYAHGDDWENVVNADTDMLVRFVQRNGNWINGDLGTIECPVLLTASRQDKDIPKIVEQHFVMMKAIRNSKLYIHDQGFHPLMWSKPIVFRAICKLFLADQE